MYCVSNVWCHGCHIKNEVSKCSWFQKEWGWESKRFQFLSKLRKSIKYKYVLEIEVEACLVLIFLCVGFLELCLEGKFWQKMLLMIFYYIFFLKTMHSALLWSISQTTHVFSSSKNVNKWIHFNTLGVQVYFTCKLA